MCGIAGYLSFDGAPASRAVIQAMTDAIAHRGPDGSGVYMNGSLALGHRRLSIIDLEGGKQPLSNETGDVWVTYNGEIYNYVELHQQLEGLGHRFKTQSDTEVIVHAYEQWGESCLERFRGMFAFAVYDARIGSLFLARDRVGIKPLFYSNECGRFAFASELQALIAMDDRIRSLDLNALDQFLKLRYISAPATIYRNVLKLPPAHWLKVGRDGQMEGPRSYWDVEFRPDFDTSEEQWLEQLNNEIHESVRLSLRSDVEFGAFLSGGVDSCTVAAHMSQLMPQQIHTFSMGFEEDGYNELPYAEFAAARCNSISHTRTVRADAMAILPELVRHFGEPFADSSAIPTYYVAESARQHVKMVLSGDGGDENLVGYDRYLAISGSLLEGPSPWRTVRRHLGDALRMLGLVEQRPLPEDIWMTMATVLDDRKRLSLTHGTSIPLTSHPEAIQVAARSPQKPDLCSWLQYFDIKSYLPAILTKVDTTSMRHGLEVRVPLLDHKVVELCARIPLHRKIRKNRDGNLEGKAVLRTLAERFYGKDFFHRPKRGFATPIHVWLNGQRDRLRGELLARESRLLDLFDEAQIVQLIEAGCSSYKAARQLWILIVLACWFREHPRVSLT